ncbi:MAG: hypothetical protein J0L92_04425 [Deltaproteobacteria bacterium]|nr:hypothetical protein [Deltaproteobacteria bacterium]
MARWVSRLGVAAVLAWASLGATATAQVRTGDPVETHRHAFEGELDAGLGVLRTEPPPVCLPGLACDLGPSLRTNAFGTLVLDATTRLATLDQDLFLEVDGDARLGLVESFRDDGSWNGFWLGNAWAALALAHRRADFTLRGAIGVALPLRTIHWTVIDRPVPGAWLGWDAWLSVWGVVPVGFTGLAEWRQRDLQVGIDTALLVAPSFSFPTTLSASPPRGVFGYLGVGGWIAGRLDAHVQLGVRVHVVGTMHVSDIECSPDDFASECRSGTRASFDATLGVIPFVRLPFGPGYVEARLAIGVIEPYGPPVVGAFQTYTLTVRGGLTWD